MTSKSWQRLSKMIMEKERQEVARSKVIERMIARASYEAHKRLIKIPGATEEMIKKIYGYTIYTTSMLDSECIYQCYLPHLKKEIERKI